MIVLVAQRQRHQRWCTLSNGNDFWATAACDR